MDTTQFNVVYNRKKRLLSNGTALVQIEAYLLFKKKYFSVGIYLTPDMWDNKHRKVKNHPNALKLNRQIIEILNRHTQPDRKYIFDDLTNQYVNRCLKELAALAGIAKTVTFHTARHTQATFLPYKGVNITTVQKLLGHKKLQTTQIYSKVMDKTIINELQAVTFG
jgi:integrase